MREFYEAFYARAPGSPAHAIFCARAFGRNLCQHGFAHISQIDALIEVAGIRPGDRVLDLGCGNGMIAEYVSDCTGAHVTGIDYIPEAIRQARVRTRDAGKSDRMSFETGDIHALTLAAGTYEIVMSIDTLYFSDDLVRTVGELVAALTPGGRLGLFYSYGWEPGMEAAAFPAETLAAERTPLGEVLQAHGLAFQARDFTGAECQGARARKVILEELEGAFEADGLRVVWENRMGEARGIGQSCALGLFRRYLYVARKNPADGQGNSVSQV